MKNFIIRYKKLLIPLLGLLLVFSIFGGLLLLTQNPPRLSRMTPETALPGDLVRIEGSGFGSSRRNSGVFLGGDLLTLSSYRTWSDNLIEIVIPELAKSGVVYVMTLQGRSNPGVFTNRKDVPLVITGNLRPGFPYLEKIQTTKGVIGQDLELLGENFGSSRERGKVYFSWGPSQEFNTESTFVAVSEKEFQEWNDRRIVVRIPFGANTGNVFVTTSKGESNRQYLEIEDLTGTKVFSAKTNYTVKFKAEIRVTKAQPGNSLYLWQPLVFTDALQQNVKVLQQSMNPIFQDFQGFSLYKLDNLAAGQNYAVELEVQLDRFGFEVQPRIERIKDGYRPDSPFYRYYTESEASLKMDQPSLKNLAKTVGGSERNPYVKALRIYNHILDQYKFEQGLDRGDLLQSLETGVLTPYTSSLLFVSLCRLSQIASRPVSGYLVDDNHLALRHHWAEFFVEGLGWLPVNLFLGARAASVTSLVADPRRYYFGNTDSQHIDLTKGFPQVRQMDAKGQLSASEIPYSLQNFSHESVGNLEGFQVIWQDLAITGVY